MHPRHRHFLNSITPPHIRETSGLASTARRSYEGTAPCRPPTPRGVLPPVRRGRVEGRRLPHRPLAGYRLPADPLRRPCREPERCEGGSPTPALKRGPRNTTARSSLSPAASHPDGRALASSSRNAAGAAEDPEGRLLHHLPAMRALRPKPSARISTGHTSPTPFVCGRDGATGSPQGHRTDGGATGLEAAVLRLRRVSPQDSEPA